MTLMRKDGVTSPLSDHLGEGLAIFYAGGPCPATLSWASELDKVGWKLEGRSITIAVTYPEALTNPAIVKALERGPEMFSTDWPPPGYLHDNRFYPIVYFVDSHGRLAGYKWADAPSVWAALEQPN